MSDKKLPREEAIMILRETQAENRQLRAENERLRRELADWRTWGIVEISVRNPNVAEYIKHWEGRAERAEAALAGARRDALEEVVKAHDAAADRHLAESDYTNARMDIAWAKHFRALAQKEE